MSTSSTIRIKLRFTVLLKPGLRRRPLQKSPRGTSIRSRFRSINAHDEQTKDLSSKELETLRRSRKPTAVLTANGEVHTNEEAQVYVYDLDLFVTVQLLEDTPAVLSLGTLCEEHGYTHEWASGQKTTPDQTREDGKFRIPCGPWIPLHRHRRTRQVHLQVQHQSEVTMEHQETGAIPETQNNKKRDNDGASGNRLRDLPEWLEEFTENLEDTEVVAPAHISHSSDSFKSGTQEARC